MRFRITERTQKSVSMLLIIALPVLVSSCTTLSGPPPASEQQQPPSGFQESPSWIWDSRPENGRLILVAAGARRGNRDEEALAALEDAALQAGVYSSFWGASQDLVVSNAAGTDWNTRTRARYDGTAADHALRNMDAGAIWRTEEATWVRFVLDLPDTRVIDWEPRFTGGRPEWLLKPPEIPGYVVAVGSGSSRSTLARTVKGAEVGALAAMIDALHGASRVVTASRETGGSFGSESSGASASYDRGFGEVIGFLVIARWVDEGGTGWALAVCPKAPNGL